MTQEDERIARKLLDLSSRSDRVQLRNGMTYLDGYALGNGTVELRSQVVRDRRMRMRAEEVAETIERLWYRGPETNEWIVIESTAGGLSAQCVLTVESFPAPTPETFSTSMTAPIDRTFAYAIEGVVNSGGNWKPGPAFPNFACPALFIIDSDTATSHPNQFSGGNGDRRRVYADFDDPAFYFDNSGSCSYTVTFATPPDVTTAEFQITDSTGVLVALTLESCPEIYIGCNHPDSPGEGDFYTAYPDPVDGATCPITPPP